MPSLRSLLGRRAPSPNPQALPRRTGLNVLYDPTAQGFGVSMDIVFVHGLNGHYIHTWEESSVCWPRDLLPRRMENARVLSFSYDADIYNSASLGRIRDHGLNLLIHLIANRPQTGIEKFERPIVFVAHSLGGLLVKEALREAKQHSEDMGHKAILAATRGFVFFSTPHGGSSEDSWLRIADGFAPLGARLGFGRGRVSPLVEALKENASSLYDLVQDFRHLAEHYALVSLYETEAYGSSGAAIVDKSSALTYLPHEEQLGIPASHTGMCRFTSLDNQWFHAVVKRIERASRGRVDSQGRSKGVVSAGEPVGVPVAFTGEAPQPRVLEVREITDGSESVSAAEFYGHWRKTDVRDVLGYQNATAVR
ncbi:Alpha/Beta hydrolase protein [Chaetomium fimeti]|uniref:Alpha/Beta hydrolase protein n=1 Tax=Chaetomium fimeti TaxID=1854472 RepID=A0AAE0LTX7_9PEZI|nr:Alpha/Beta hydrolase protein [Chaetomium fimeti]